MLKHFAVPRQISEDSGFTSANFEEIWRGESASPIKIKDFDTVGEGSPKEISSKSLLERWQSGRMQLTAN